MKKAQVLSAIALAFALGVVAPVAGVVNTASAITITEGGVVTADRQDVIDTVKAIEGQTEYQQYKALVDALADETTDTISTPSLTTLVNGIKALGDDYDNYKKPTTGTTSEQYQTVIDDAEAAIAAVSGKSYNLWSNLYVAMTNDDTKNNSEDELAGAIVNAVKALGMTVEYNAEDDDLDAVKAKVNETSYDSYSTLLGNIVKAQKQVDAINAKIDALKTALAPFVDSRDLTAAVADDEPIDALETLAADVTTHDAASKTRYDNYTTLIGAVTSANNLLKTATNFTKDDTTNNALTTINSLKSLYKAAAGTDLVVSGTPSTDPTNPGVTIRTLTSENGEVTVTGAFPADVTLKVEPTTTEVFGDKTYEAYDITLMKGDTKYDFNGSAAVTIKVSKVDAAKSTVYYVDSDNKAIALTSTYTDSYITFNTTHFSLYAVVEGADADNNGDDTTPGNTGAIATASGTASSTVAVVAGIATALTAAGAGVVAYRNARRSTKE